MHLIFGDLGVSDSKTASVTGDHVLKAVVGGPWQTGDLTEALTNDVRHSGATRWRVDLGLLDG